MQEIQDNIGTVSGAIIAGLFALGAIISKFRVWWTRDSNEAAISIAQSAVVEMQRQELARLHEQVLALQQDITKYQLIVSELTIRHAEHAIREEEVKKTNELAKQGLIDRRSK